MRRGHIVGTIAIAVLVATTSSPAGASGAGADQAVAVEVTRAQKALPAAEGRDLARLYLLSGGQPVWLLPDGRDVAATRPALRMLAAATADGLDPDSYDAAGHVARLATLGTPAAVADFDVRLSAAVLRFYRHLHLGRVDPRTLGFALRQPADTHDFALLLHDAIAAGRVAERARNLAPALSQYERLRDALARYRRLAATAPPMPAFEGTVRPGDPYGDVARLRQLLVALGDAPGEAPPSTEAIYDPATSESVGRFQSRHGLDPDGVIGPGTQAALAVPLDRRVRQIELALERLRWLPDLGWGRLIVVNIPMFRLDAWNSVPSNDPPVLSMRVVVGRAVRTQTPVFADQMEHVIFLPYWNVPTSILRNEMLPAIRRDVGYLARENLEIVQGPGDRSPVVPATADAITRLGQGDLRLRQRPGPGNALGTMKFIFPNDNDVYMHDTPAPALFARSRRDFSHGCIRVEDPVGLAEWVLSDLPDWPREAIVAATKGTPNRRVNLPEPIQVVIFYMTAAVDPSDGTVRFAADIYGHDSVLDRALR